MDWTRICSVIALMLLRFLSFALRFTWKKIFGCASVLMSSMIGIKSTSHSSTASALTEALTANSGTRKSETTENYALDHEIDWK